MADDILSMYGNNTPQPQKPPAKSGGVMQAKPMPYDPPKGPLNMMGGYDVTNHGNCGSQGK